MAAQEKHEGFLSSPSPSNATLDGSGVPLKRKHIWMGKIDHGSISKLGTHKDALDMFYLRSEDLITTLRYTYRCKATRIFSILDPQKTHGLLTARSTGPLEIQKRKFLLNPSDSTWGLVALITYIRNIPATHPTQSLQTIRFLLLVVMIPDPNLSQSVSQSFIVILLSESFPWVFLCVVSDRKKYGEGVYNINLKWWAKFGWIDFL